MEIVFKKDARLRAKAIVAEEAISEASYLIPSLKHVIQDNRKVIDADEYKRAMEELATMEVFLMDAREALK